MIYHIRRTKRFDRALKKMAKRGKDLTTLEKVVDLLAAGDPLPEQLRDHPLKGKWSGHRECHIQPDWLLVYLIENDVLVLTLVATGTHSDLFDE